MFTNFIFNSPVKSEVASTGGFRLSANHWPAARCKENICELDNSKLGSTQQ